MQRNDQRYPPAWSRRRFLGTAAAVAAPLVVPAWGRAAERPPPAPAAGTLAFAPADKEYRFDTGLWRGTLRSQGRSLGLMPVADATAGTAVTHGFGLLSHYRLLDAQTRYGHGAWDWASTARVLPDGAVEVAWSADAAHPFDLRAVYRWTAPHTCDVTTRVVPRQPLVRFEVFLASYFAGFPASFVYVQACPETGGQAGLLEAKKAVAVWQMFPRDAEAVQIIGDGRWQRPPNPVDWKIMPPLAGPLAVRRDAATGLAALVMAPPDDCFAVATPFGEEGHRSLYLSLLGRDVAAGQTATARARLVLARDVSDAQAVALYQAYVQELAAGASPS